ncbi:hypothetical protein C3489_26265 [Streptomyces sp. Ru71]|uniref:NlpC/P60 family protein n=1 Tax=Streptomyces sp. Ru71 TaxID=2080746 RepID=UPI000CDE110D|nr:NlpC/P60 family protein [Streptomyces sp. Ru71]POX48805.1 hypothetical protein C3489_26265 [Streptomyces sp. Ru71]
MRADQRTTRTVGIVLAMLGLLGATAFLTVAVRERQPGLDEVASPHLGRHAGRQASYRYERLTGPARTVVRDARGSVVATLTDGARTAVLTGPSRTFTEPRTTAAVVTSDSWVRLMPRPWSKGTEGKAWFRDWFAQYEGSARPDILAMAMQYGDRVPPRKDAHGLRYAGDAQFGPLNPKGALHADLRLESSDFYDYLGVAWRFTDGRRLHAEHKRYGAVDCSGYIRLVYGYRAGFPLNASDRSRAHGLPRSADAIARRGPGVPVIPLGQARPASIGALQPGDLLFFELDARTGAALDHAAIYLGLDTEGHPRFLSSREEANGPTMGDLGGSSRLDGKGFYAKALRGAKRL